MIEQTIKSLHNDFSIENQLSITEGVEGDDSFPFISIKNEHASAIISIYGAHILSYNPLQKSDEDLLFVSPKAIFKHGKAIRGGIPLCWPWFGKYPESSDTNSGRGMHGFARNQMWLLKETGTNRENETLITLALSDNEASRKIWPHTFELELKVTVGKTLKLELTTLNTSKESFVMTQALHTYFSVGDISHVSVNGLDSTDYLDTTKDSWPTVKQQGDILFDQRTDRIYTQAPPQVTLVDKMLKRQTLISSTNSNSTVVWNPWVDISKEMVDLEDDSYKNFVCVETTNAASDSIEVKPNESFCLSTEYTMSEAK